MLPCRKSSYGGASQGGTAMSNLSPEIERKLRNLDPEDMKKVTSFFYLVEAGDKRATEIWSMANNKEMEPKQVADLIYDYMDLNGFNIVAGHRSPLSFTLVGKKSKG